LVAWNGTTGSGQDETMTLAQQRQQAPVPPARPAAPSAPQTQQQQAAPAPVVPQRSERTVQDSWTINCVQMKTSDPKKTCSAIMQVAEPKNRRVVFAWVIGRTPDGVMTSVFQTPTRVLLQKGVELKLGNAAPHKADFVVCSNQSCEASLPMNDAVIREAMAAAGGNAVATVTVANGQAVNFTMPIKGIDKVLAAIGR
jgi:invasion protein IalB